MRRFYLLTIVIFLMASCASVEIVKSNPDMKYEKGLRFYRPHPYLWVTKDDNGALQSTIIWLPNKKEDYMIRVKGGIGTVDLKCTLENGWNLTEFGETMDSKTPEMITALTGSLQGITTMGLEAKGTFIPGLYKFTFDKDGLIDGLIPVVQFKQ